MPCDWLPLLTLKPPRRVGVITGGTVEEIVRALAPTASGAEPRLAPRVQPIQLFNRGFEQCDDVRLTVDDYRKLTQAAWPEEERLPHDEAERHFWKLMAEAPVVKQKGVSGLGARRPSELIPTTTQSLARVPAPHADSACSAPLPCRGC